MSIVNAMTVDVEDYFHVSAFDTVVSRARWDAFDSRVSHNTDRLLELFDLAHVRSTFFVLGWVAERFPALVRRIVDQGHEVASHGYHHQLLYMLTPRQFREDVRAAKTAIEDAAGVQVVGFRAPSYSVIQSSLWALDVLIEEGFAYDSSIFPIHHDRYGIPDSPRHPYVLRRAGGSLMEVPGSTVRLGASTCRSGEADTSGSSRTRGRSGASIESTASSASR
jgi:polysaccharide deacetylase family protein (PEP-CTERM system associated)